MNSFLHKYFHEEMRDKNERGRVSIPTDETLWPDSWFSHEQKSYKFLPSINLFKNTNFDKENILTLLKKRSSEVSDILDNKVNLDNLSYVLRCGYSNIRFSTLDKVKKVLYHRTVPSAGARYSCEIYIHIFKDGSDIKAGVYHYNPDEDTIECVKSHLDKSFSLTKDFEKVNGLISITSVLDRVTRKYGSRGYRFALLEAGHISQNMILGGLEKDFYFRPVAALDELKIEEDLGISPELEVILYTILF